MKMIATDRLGGAFMFIGAAIILITIFFEYRIGWIGVERSEGQTLTFIYDNWPQLKTIWGWQTLGHTCFLIAYVQLLKNAAPMMRVCWSVLLICGVMVVIAFGLTLGSYYPALEVYDTQPELFESLRGGIGILYRTGITGIVLFGVVFLMETFSNDGIVNRLTGLITIGVIVLSILAGLIINIPMKVTGASWFLLPLMLGYFYWRNTKTQIPT